jgi:hypothetical protein
MTFIIVNRWFHDSEKLMQCKIQQIAIKPEMYRMRVSEGSKRTCQRMIGGPIVEVIQIMSKKTHPSKRNHPKDELESMVTEIAKRHRSPRNAGIMEKSAHHE